MITLRLDRISPKDYHQQTKKWLEDKIEFEITATWKSLKNEDPSRVLERLESIIKGFETMLKNESEFYADLAICPNEYIEDGLVIYHDTLVVTANRSNKSDDEKLVRKLLKKYKKNMNVSSVAKVENSQRFIDYLRIAEDIDCSLIIGGSDMPADFVWIKDMNLITEAGYQEFKDVLDAPYTLLENGNIEILNEDYKIGIRFVKASAGYVSELYYESWFVGEWTAA